MIYEMRTYDLKPRTQAEFEKRFGEAYEKRKNYSPLAAFWHTEIGPLNQVIHVWPYKDIEERNRIRAAAAKDGIWPPPTTEFIDNMRSEIFMPFTVSPELKPGKLGPYFEMRTYTHAAGDLPKLRAVWEKGVPERLKYSPLCAAWYSELGGLNKFVHIWPYPSLDARMSIREQTQAAGVWPPNAAKLGLPGYNLVLQENKILMPSAFSPLQ